MCSLCFENNFLSIGHVRFDNSRLAIKRVLFALKIICLLSKVFASLRYIEENTIIEAFVRFRLASVAITNKDAQLLKYSVGIFHNMKYCTGPTDNQI
jgi:hypothetical protein